MLRLPGDPKEKKYIESVIRVDHAGEFGAKRIYEGQLAVLGKSQSAETLIHMRDQEIEHLSYFEKAIVEHKARPTVLLPIWNVAGFLMGAITALMGEKAAMACTVAVEDVIEKHYQQQADKLQDGDLKTKINQFRQEEIEHHDIALEREAASSAMFVPISIAVKTASKLAIWLSKRI